ncbi:MAG TPA: DUF433 domain-containing protein [Candidatus Eremiobacteraceae bacterium]|nr:DUF433 domain-containing protein [Candidatus Eremiobacteraceae bacterium]
MRNPFFRMPRKRLFRTTGDVRDFPRYGISEAAHYVRIPATTLYAWTKGQDYRLKSGHEKKFKPLIYLADDKNGLLSFYNLVEAHILRFTTEERNVPMQSVRKALDFVQEAFPGPHPLLTHEFETSGKDVFIIALGRTINATAYGQGVLRELLEQYLKLIPRDAKGLPMRVFPINSKHLAIDPYFSSGKPIVRDRGITASVLWGRSKSGETFAQIANDYGMTDSEVKEAIEEYEWKAAA